MKFEVGMYVRNKEGIISIINQIIYQDKTYVQFNLGGRLDYKDELKASHNIMDLVEENDVIKIYYENEGEYCIGNVYKFYHFNFDHPSLAVAFENRIGVLKNGKVYEMVTFKEVDENFKIVSIVTKEQFSSMEYKI